jgi:hypothetical protein
VNPSQLMVAVTTSFTSPALEVQVTNPSGEVSNAAPLTVM